MYLGEAAVKTAIQRDFPASSKRYGYTLEGDGSVVKAFDAYCQQQGLAAKQTRGAALPQVAGKAGGLAAPQA